MSDYVKVGKVDDFREGRGTAVRVGDTKVAIFRVGDRLRAIQDRCPHMGASLADGRVEGGRVECHWHGWCFDLKSGQGDQQSKRWLRARIYEIKVDGDDVYVLRPEEPAPRSTDDGEEWVPWDDDFLKKNTDDDRSGSQ
jgi:nitrite reductase (NADH) small subunit/3-phenylpropionate/trans-cinnamate dioxygenase ferredoxin subunit